MQVTRTRGVWPPIMGSTAPEERSAMHEAKKLCYEVQFRGTVQGVGFRYSTCRIARRFDVGGYVKNMPDGSVLLVAEGPPQEVELFVAAVCDQMKGYIRQVIKTRKEATGRFRAFEIRY